MNPAAANDAKNNRSRINVVAVRAAGVAAPGALRG
jgi:hypothetical protein